MHEILPFLRVVKPTPNYLLTADFFSQPIYIVTFQIVKVKEKFSTFEQGLVLKDSL
jgi:hypothetical protein